MIGLRTTSELRISTFPLSYFPGQVNLIVLVFVCCLFEGGWMKEDPRLRATKKKELTVLNRTACAPNDPIQSCGLSTAGSVEHSDGDCGIPLPPLSNASAIMVLAALF